MGRKWGGNLGDRTPSNQVPGLSVYLCLAAGIRQRTTALSRTLSRALILKAKVATVTVIAGRNIRTTDRGSRSHPTTAAQYNQPVPLSANLIRGKKKKEKGRCTLIMYVPARCVLSLAPLCRYPNNIIHTPNPLPPLASV